MSERQAVSPLSDDAPARHCREPFTKVVIDPHGRAYLCCPTWLRNSVGNVFGEHAQDLSGIWLSNAARAIRASVLSGSYEFCDPLLCPYLISGVYVPREPRGLAASERLVSPEGPTTLTIGYDRTCNLRCRFCRADAIGPDGQQAEQLLESQARLVESPLFSALRKLILAGQGEVFASRIYLSLLRSIRQERFPQLRITLLTNGLLLTPAMWETVTGAHYAIDEIKISIDAASPAVYEGLRSSGNYALLQRNLRFLASIKKQQGLVLHAAFVVQQANYREMPAFVRMCQSLGFDHVYFSALVDFKTYSREEYLQAAIHREDHPEHASFLETLKDPALSSPGVSVKIKLLGPGAGQAEPRSERRMAAR